MKIYSLCLFSLLFLAACVPYTPSDPVSQVMQGQAAQTNTAQAAFDESARTTEQAADDEHRTTNEIARIMAPIRASQTAMALAITAGAATSTSAAATSTEQAFQTTATNNAAVATSTQAIVDYQLAQQKQSDEERTANARYWAGFWKIVIGLLISGLVIALVVFIWRVAGPLGKDLGSWIIEWLDRRYSVYVDPKWGRLTIWQDPNATYKAGIISESPYRAMAPHAYPNLNESRPDGVSSIGASVLSSASCRPDDSPAGLVRRLVADSIDVNGAESNIVPSWMKLKAHGFDWSSTTWENAKGALESLAIVNGRKGSRTKLVGEYHCLMDLDIAIRENRIKVRRGKTSPPCPVAGD